jgi:hypothetical protein
MLPKIASKFRVEALVYRRGGPINNSWHDTGPLADSWVPASESSINWLFASDPSRRRRFLRFLHSGCLGLFLVRDGRWISHCWSTQPGSKWTPPHLPRWVWQVGACWMFYGHTREVFRGQGVQKRILAQFISLIHARNPDGEIFTDILPENVPSNRAAIRSGFTPSGVIVTYKLWVPFLGSLVLGGKWRREQPHSPQYLPLEPAVKLQPALGGLLGTRPGPKEKEDEVIS